MKGTYGMLSSFNMQWVIGKESAGLLIKDFLKMEQISRAALTDIKFQGGSILVNGSAVNVRYKLTEGEKLSVVFPPETPSFEGESIPMSILYEDDYLLVVNKPAGMSTIPSREHPNGSLANAIVGYYHEIGLQATAHIVTRLDRDTSGIVLVAKHRHIHHLFSLMQKCGQVKRTYEAFAEGVIDHEQGTIEASIGRKPSSIIEREVREDGQYARTHYHVLGRYKRFTHVELKLDTGRTHQIRVHLSYLGHPLLGDDLYGGPLTLIQRQALHCKEIHYIHPVSHKRINLTAPLPKDMGDIFHAARI